MRPVAAQENVKLVGASHHRAGVYSELPGRQPRPVVHAEYRIDRVKLEQALFDHHAGATVGFFGGLEDEHHRAVEFAHALCTASCEELRGAQQHGGVAVVAASVHAAIVPGAVRKHILLTHR